MPPRILRTNECRAHGVGLLRECVEKRGGTTGVLYQRAREKGERERTGYVRTKIRRDTALRHRRRELDTDTERRERVNVYINKMTNSKQQPTMGRGSVTTEQAGEQMRRPIR